MTARLFPFDAANLINRSAVFSKVSTDVEVRSSKVVTPLGNAMRFIDDGKVDKDFFCNGFELRTELDCLQSFRCEEGKKRVTSTNTS